MNIIELSKTEYKNLVKVPFSKFDSIEFCELNSSKVSQIKYLAFNDGKFRFGLIMGIKEGILCAPFSAPYSCPSEISNENKISSYSKFAPSLIDYSRKINVNRIRVTLPPNVYDDSHISKFYNSFYVAGFRLSGCDINFQYDLGAFNNYESSIDIKARQKLRSSIKEGLQFKKTEDIKAVYDIILLNRIHKKYPLWMTYQNILDTTKIIKTDFFIVYDSDHKAVAAAILYHVSTENIQVIYWGNLPNTDELKSMNFMGFKIFEYYSNQNLKFIDLGPSTEFSIPNFGLCDFKQSIGCGTSLKLTFEYNL